MGAIAAAEAVVWRTHAEGLSTCDPLTKSHPLGIGERSLYLLVPAKGSMCADGDRASATRTLGNALEKLGEHVRFVTWSEPLQCCVFADADGATSIPRHERIENHWLVVADPIQLAALGLLDIAAVIRWARRHGVRVGFLLPHTEATVRNCAASDYAAATLRRIALADCVWTATENFAETLRGWWRNELLADSSTMPRTSPLVASDAASTAGEAPLGGLERHASALSKSLSSFIAPSWGLKPIYYCIDATLAWRGNSGIQRVTRQLARGLLEHSAELIPFQWNASARRMAGVDRAGLEWFAEWNGPVASAWTAWREPERSESGGWMLVPELLLNRTAGERRRLLAQARRAGLRCAIIFFDAIPWKMRGIYPRRSAVDHRDYMMELAEYDLVLPISEHSRQDLVDFLSATAARPMGLEHLVRTVVLPGEFPECPRGVSRADALCATMPITVLCVGTVEPRKNHETLLAAFSLAADQSRVPLRLIIAGSGKSFDPALTARVEAFVRDRSDIEWIRDADDGRLRDLYAACEFTVYPSIEEGFGLPILESLWQARPCICADFGAMRHVAAGGGCTTTNVRDVESLAAAILRLAEDPVERKRLAEEAVVRRFKTWRHYAADVLERLRETVGSTPPSESQPQKPNPAASERVAAIPVRPRLSVCISTYNRGRWLEVALANWTRLHPQPRPGLELLICDNASTDDTAAVVRRYATRGDLISHRNDINVGMLGNLRETADRARGEHVWIIGDDDLIMPGSIERILTVLERHPRLPLLYLNYAFTTIDDPETIVDLAGFFAGATPIVRPEADRFGPIRTIAARNENFFTAIYTCVFRRDHALRAYSRDTSGRPFSSLSTCVPTTCHVLEEMMEQSGYWMGKPQIVVNTNVSWGRYAPLWILERIPEIYDLAEWRGADPDEVDRWRRHTLRAVPHFFAEIFGADDTGNAPYFRAERLVRRFGHLAEFDDIREALGRIYTRAWEQGHPQATLHPMAVFGSGRHAGSFGGRNHAVRIG